MIPPRGGANGSGTEPGGPEAVPDPYSAAGEASDPALGPVPFAPLEAAGGDVPESPSPAPRGPVALGALAACAAAVALLVAGLAAGRRLGTPDAGAALPPAASAASAPAAGSAAPPPNAQAAATAQAAADAAAAQSQAAQAESAAGQAQALLLSAQTAAAEVAELSAPALARNPSAADPSADLAPIEQDDAQAVALAAQAQQAEAAVDGAASGAAQIAQTDANAATAASQAQAAQNRAQAALAQAQASGSAIGSLVTAAESDVQAWQAVRSAPAGYFGAQVEDAPASFGVSGCEVDSTDPGSPAARAGLVGKTQRTDPVGDVVTSITDATDGDAVWPVPDCAAYQAALVQTRSGDQVTVAFYHRQVVWYLLSGKWVAQDGTATLAAAPGADCPRALTGTITPALTGSRINLDITLSGPAASRSGLQVMLDTGGVQTYFPDALLQSLGFRPFLPALVSGVVPGATAAGNLYRVAGSQLLVEDAGQLVPLATGTLTVEGIVGGDVYGLAPDILKQGASLSTAGDKWALTPPCAAG